MEIESYLDVEKNHHMVILWKGDDVIEKHMLASIYDVEQLLQVLKRTYPTAVISHDLDISQQICY